MLSKAVRYQKWILSEFAPEIHGSVLEVGAGIGNFTRLLVEQATEVWALEPDQGACRLIEELSLPKVRVLCAPLSEFHETRQRFDTAVFINVLEHIENDSLALSTVHQLLRPRGGVCLLVPAHNWLYGPIDARFGHFRRYPVREVRQLLESTGFHVETCRYFNPVGALGWLLFHKVLRRQQISPRSVWLSERLAIPIGKRLEVFGEPPFGQSVFAFGRAV